MEEIWKDIDEFEGLYQISNLGRIKSLPKQQGKRITKEKTPDWSGVFIQKQQSFSGGTKAPLISFRI